MNDEKKIERHKAALKKSSLLISEDGTAFEDSEKGLAAAKKYRRQTGRSFKKFKRLSSTKSKSQSSKNS